MGEQKACAVPIERQAAAVANSRFFRDVTTTDRALTILLLADELDIQHFEALRGMRLIEGQLSMSAGLISSKIKRSGQFDYTIKSTSAEECTLEWWALRRKADGSEVRDRVGESQFTFAQAKKAKLDKPLSGWDRYPEDMCFARALTRGARRFCPGIFGGSVYTPEELGSLAAEREGGRNGAPVPAPQGEGEREELKKEVGDAFERSMEEHPPQLTGAEAGQDGPHGEDLDAEPPTAEEEAGQTRESVSGPSKPPARDRSCAPLAGTPSIQDQAYLFIGKYRELQYPDKKIVILAKMQPKPLHDAVMAFLEPAAAPAEKPAPPGPQQERAEYGARPAPAANSQVANSAPKPLVPQEEGRNCAPGESQKEFEAKEHTKQLLDVCQKYDVDDATKAKWLAFFKTGKLEDLTPEQVAKIMKKAHATYGGKGEEAK